MLADAKLTISLHDEAGKIDINAASEELIRGLGRALKLEAGAWDKVADAILDWRDDDDLKRLNGAENAAYEQAGLPYGPKNGFFQSIDEIQQVLGVDHVNYRQISTAITIYSGRASINAETAPRVALMSLPAIVEQDVNELLATREANRYDAPRKVLPQLNDVGNWLHGDKGPVYTVRSTARIPRGTTFTREAVIWIPDKGEQRYWILDWRVPAAQTATKKNDDPESKQ